MDMFVIQFMKVCTYIGITQLSKNAKSEHFPTFSNGTHCIFYVYSWYLCKKNFKKGFEFFFGSIGIRTLAAKTKAMWAKTQQILSTIKYAQWAISIKMVQRVAKIHAEAQTIAKNVRTKRLHKAFIVGIPNYSHHQSYTNFPDSVIVFLWRQSSDDIINPLLQGLWRPI